MFRITCTERPVPHVKIDGNLVGLFVNELRTACAPRLAAGGPLQLDLSGIGFADESGVALLGELATKGAELLGTTPFLRELLCREAAPRAQPESAERRRERALLAALRRGDDSAHEELVRRHGPALLTLARRFLPDAEDAQRALREAFRSAFDELGSLSDGTRLATWLRGHVVRAAMLVLRGAGARPEPDVEPMLPRFAKSGTRLQDDADRFLALEGPGAHLEDLTPELATEVRRCVELLPRTERAVLLLCDIEGFGLPEASVLLGVDLNEARRRLHRARQALRHLLGRALAAAHAQSAAHEPLSA